MPVPTRSYIIDTTRTGNNLKVVSNIGIIMPRGATTERPNDTGNPDVLSNDAAKKLIFAGTLRWNTSPQPITYVESDVAWNNSFVATFPGDNQRFEYWDGNRWRRVPTSGDIPNIVNSSDRFVRKSGDVFYGPVTMATSNNSRSVAYRNGTNLNTDGNFQVSQVNFLDMSGNDVKGLVNLVPLNSILIINSTGALQPPKGTAAQRPGSITDTQSGIIRYNTDVKRLECYYDPNWHAFVNLDGDTMQGVINMGAFQIKNLANPTDPQDALTYNYADNRYVNVTGDTMTGKLIMSDNLIANLGDALADYRKLETAVTSDESTNALNVRVADSRYANVTGDQFFGIVTISKTTPANPIDPDPSNRIYLDMQDNQIRNLGDPSSVPPETGTPSNNEKTFALNLGYADRRYWRTGGGNTPVSDINMGGFKLINLGTATNPGDALSLGLGDSRYVNVTGDAMTGDLDMQGRFIHNVSYPTSVRDAVPWQYADARYLGLDGTAGTGPMGPDYGNMRGNFSMAGHRLMNVPSPQAQDDAISLIFADNRYVNVTGATMYGALNIITDSGFSDQLNLINSAGGSGKWEQWCLGSVNVPVSGMEFSLVNSGFDGNYNTQRHTTTLWARDDITLWPRSLYGTLRNNWTIDGNTLLTGTLNVNGKSYFHDDVQMDKNLNVDLDVRSKTLHVWDTGDINHLFCNDFTDRGWAHIIGATTLDSTLDCHGNAHFYSNVQIDGNLYVTGDIYCRDIYCRNIHASGDIDCQNLHVRGNATIDGSLYVGGDISCNNLTVRGNLHVIGNIQLDGHLLNRNGTSRSTLYYSQVKFGANSQDDHFEGVQYPGYDFTGWYNDCNNNVNGGVAASNFIVVGIISMCNIRTANRGSVIDTSGGSQGDYGFVTYHGGPVVYGGTKYVISQVPLGSTGTAQDGSTHQYSTRGWSGWTLTFFGGSVPDVFNALGQQGV